LQVAYFDQQRDQLNPQASIMDNVTGGSGDSVIIEGKARHVSGYLRDFLFPPERLQAPVSMLSGGERNRLLLARLFARPSNLLVMDEPTNDLDADTLDLLEEMVSQYTGTLLLVSHDRARARALGSNGDPDRHRANCRCAFAGGALAQDAPAYRESNGRGPPPVVQGAAGIGGSA
jgi:ATPase subunit of ABC transporter with duplicated ATPase domains